MNVLRIFLFIALVSTSGFSQAKEMPTQGPAVVGTRVSLKPPAGFIPSPQFPGYWLESLGSSIMVTELPVPFPIMSAGLANPSELMSKRGISLLNKQEVKVAGRSGLLVQAKQNAFGTEYLKWLLIFGDEKESVMITASFPKELGGELSKRMKASILTATWNREKNVSLTEGLNFTVDEKGELKIAKRIANLLMFTSSGIFPSKDVDAPVFIVGQSVSKVEIVNPEEFANARIRQTATITNFDIEQSNRVTIDNLNGYEIVAKGKDKASGQSMLVYQVLLFEEQSYYLMQGLVRDINRQPNLEIFKGMARTFKRKK